MSPTAGPAATAESPGPDPRERTVVVVGASVAGVRCVTALRDAGHVGAIVLVEAEGGEPYDKPQLSKRLDGEHELQLLADEAGLRARDVDHRPGTTATGLDRGRQVLETSAGPLAYDDLVLAVGGRARRPPDLPARAGCIRTREDWTSLRAALAPGRRLVVVGAGFLGLEVAAAARTLGVEVTVVDVAPAVLTRGVPRTVADLVAARHRAEGVDLRLGVGDPRLGGDGETVSVDGVTGVTGDVALVAIGAAPDLGWLDASGLTLDDGVVCDAGLRAAPGVWAVGDCARWDNARYGRSERHEHWTSAVRQAQHVARSIASGEHAPMAELPYVWSDQFDWRIQAVGRTGTEEQHFVLGSGGHVVLGTADGAVTGVTTIGAPAVSARARQLLQREDPPLDQVVPALGLDALEPVA